MNPPSLPAIDVVGTAVLFTLGNLGVAWFRPFKTCRRCEGYGKVARRSGRGRPRPCRRCRGNGIRLRLSRRVLNLVRARFRAANFGPAEPVTVVPDSDANLAGAHARHLATVAARFGADGAWRGLTARLGDRTDGDR